MEEFEPQVYKDNLLKEECLRRMHLDEWPEDILSDGTFGSSISWVLTKRERIVLEEKIRHYEDRVPNIEADRMIAKDLRMTVKNVVQLCFYLKRKLRYMMNPEVQHQLRRHLIKG